MKTINCVGGPLDRHLNSLLLNQARAGPQAGRAWFLRIEVLQDARLSLNGFSHHRFSPHSFAFSAILRVNRRYRTFYGKNHRHYCDLNANQVCYTFRYVLSYFHNENELTKLKPLISGRSFIFEYKLQYILTSKMADFKLIVTSHAKPNYYVTRI